jgi:hypothetical protein
MDANEKKGGTKKNAQFRKLREVDARKEQEFYRERINILSWRSSFVVTVLQLIVSYVF